MARTITAAGPGHVAWPPVHTSAAVHCAAGITPYRCRPPPKLAQGGPLLQTPLVGYRRPATCPASPLTASRTAAPALRPLSTEGPTPSSPVQTCPPAPAARTALFPLHCPLAASHYPLPPAPATRGGDLLPACIAAPPPRPGRRGPAKTRQRRHTPCPSGTAPPGAAPPPSRMPRIAAHSQSGHRAALGSTRRHRATSGRTGPCCTPSAPAAPALRPFLTEGPTPSSPRSALPVCLLSVPTRSPPLRPSTTTQSLPNHSPTTARCVPGRPGRLPRPAYLQNGPMRPPHGRPHLPAPPLWVYRPVAQ